MGLLDQIIAAESGGNPNARNSRSSAGGLGQIIDSTWLDLLNRHRPDLVGGRSRQELLALKFDPVLNREMTGAYASDNQAHLAKYGLPVTPANTHLAHFAGPGGATKVLQSDPNAPVSAILGQAAVDANPFLRDMRVSDLQAWAAKKMGGASKPSMPAASTPMPATPPPAPPQPIEQPKPAVPPAPFQAGFSSPGIDSIPEQPMPLFFPQRKPIDLSALRAALARIS